MPANKKPRPKANRVRCVVCHTLVFESECVDTYADYVCRVCDDELIERDEDTHEAETQREIDRVWGYES